MTSFIMVDLYSEKKILHSLCCIQSIYDFIAEYGYEIESPSSISYGAVNVSFSQNGVPVAETVSHCEAQMCVACVTEHIHFVFSFVFLVALSKVQADVFSLRLMLYSCEGRSW